MTEITDPACCLQACPCEEPHERTRLVVVTGGPGAGKTAALEIIRKELCQHVAILPEAASIVFGGGFWRLDSLSARKAAQRAILAIQREMEKLVFDENKWALGLCDRGMPDGFAYWPNDEEAFWKAAGTSLEDEYKKYHAVIHLRTPNEELGYNYQNPLRTETPGKALEIDEQIHEIWSGHPRYHMVESTRSFLAKTEKTMEHIVQYMPICCRSHLPHVPAQRVSNG